MRALNRKTKWGLFIASFGIVPFYVAPFVVLTLLVSSDISPLEVSLFPATMMLAQLLVVSFLPFVANGANLNKVGQLTFSVTILVLAIASYLEMSVSVLVLQSEHKAGSFFNLEQLLHWPLKKDFLRS